MKLTSILNSLALRNFIVDEGTSGVWTYRKWRDGTSECWGKVSQSVTSWTAWGSMYEAKPASQGTYPSGLFVETPHISVTAHYQDGATAGVELYTGATKDKTPLMYALRPNAGSTGITINMNVYARGRWT